MMFTFSVDWLAIAQLVIAVILPVLVGLVTTRVTSGGTKAVLLAALATVTSLLTEAVDANAAGNAYDLGAGLTTAVGTFIIAVALHYGLWKPTGVSEAAQKSLVKQGRHEA